MRKFKSVGSLASAAQTWPCLFWERLFLLPRSQYKASARADMDLSEAEETQASEMFTGLASVCADGFWGL